jgi:hypothetical protein
MFDSTLTDQQQMMAVKEPAAISDAVIHPFTEAVFPQARQEGRDALDAAATLSEERHCRRLERVDFEAAAPK